MLLLPKTPPLTYPNIKEFKGPKRHHFTHSLTSLTHSLFTSQSLASLALVSGGGGRRREEMASSLTIKESFKVNAARARLARG